MPKDNQLKKVDVYAYAVVLFQIVTGIKPWESLTPHEIQLKVLSNCRPEFPETCLDKSKKALIQYCWNQDPHERPSFHEIVDNLNNN